MHVENEGRKNNPSDWKDQLCGNLQIFKGLLLFIFGLHETPNQIIDFCLDAERYM